MKFTTQADLVAYVVDHINQARADAADITLDAFYAAADAGAIERADQRPVTADDVVVTTTTDHVDETGAPKRQVKVTGRVTGSVFYLDLPADYTPKGTTTVVPATDETTVPTTATTAPDTVAVPNDLDALTVKDLQSLAGDLGIPKGGTKSVLIARIQEHAAST